MISSMPQICHKLLNAESYQVAIVLLPCSSGARFQSHKPHARRMQLLDANCKEGVGEDEQSCARQEVLVCLHQTCVFAARRASAAATTVVHSLPLEGVIAAR